MSHAIELTAGDLRLVLRPDVGGSVAGLWCGSVPVLRSRESADLHDVMQAASHPLLPYPSRINQSRFPWRGGEVITRPNFDGAHSIHGVGWLRSWSVVSTSSHEAEIALHHAGDADWPFAFDATQRFTLTPGVCDMHISFTNRASVPAPLGLGWHPFFPQRTQSRVSAHLTERWECDADVLPTHKVPQSGIDGPVVELGYDHCFDGWSGSAHIEDELLAVEMSSNLRYLVVYTPPDRPFFCVEPISLVPNAFNAPDPAERGVITLQPGETTTAWMRLVIRAV